MRVAVIVPNDVDIRNFHQGLIQGLQACNMDVTIICPDGPYVPQFREWGVAHIPIVLDRFTSLRTDLRLLHALTDILRAGKFDIVHNHTIKPNIYGTLAAKRAGVPTILGSVHGMGSMFTESAGLKRQALRGVVMGLYALAFRFIDRVQFLNSDDMMFFTSHRLISPHKAVLIRSIGVNLSRFHAADVEPSTLEHLRAELDIDAETRVVMMVARAYWSKGVHEFVMAAEALSAQQKVVCVLAGAAEDGPDAVPVEYLRAHESPGFRWLGFRRDVRDLMALADVVVLPSFYPEGVPKSLLEAMAMQKPIVTTNNRGCREVIEDGKNGFMIPIKDTAALTNALDKLLRDPAMRAAFGAYSRQKAAREFDEAVVVQQVLRRLYQFEDTVEPDGMLAYRQHAIKRGK